MTIFYFTNSNICCWNSYSSHLFFDFNRGIIISVVSVVEKKWFNFNIQSIIDNTHYTDFIFLEYVLIER